MWWRRGARLISEPGPARDEILALMKDVLDAPQNLARRVSVTCCSRPRPTPPRRPMIPPLRPRPWAVGSVALTPAAQATLKSLIAAASAAIGRKASASAVVQAMSEWTQYEHLGAELVRLIAAELQAERGGVGQGTASGDRTSLCVHKSTGRQRWPRDVL